MSSTTPTLSHSSSFQQSPIYVIKRDNSRELYSSDKIKSYLSLVSKDQPQISIDGILFLLSAAIYNDIRTTTILSTLIRITADKITETTPEYQFIAARLMINEIRREVWNSFTPPDSFYDRIRSRSCYDPIIFKLYTRSDFDYIEQNIINYDRDYLLTYSGIRQFYDKYLIKHRVTNQLLELPQEANILICMYMFKDYTDNTIRMHYISRMYHYLSTLVISLPTPIYAGVRTKLRSFSSCCVMDVGDSTDEILTVNYYIGKTVTHRFGIGVNVNKVRSIGAPIANGSVVHTGIVPFLKMFEASTKGFMQNGIRGGGGTVSFPFWNWEVLTLLEVKNNKGVQENRVRSLDYSIGLNKLFLQRAIKNEDITLFSAEDVPLLSNDYTLSFEDFTRIYTEYENTFHIRKQKIPGQEFLKKICKERFETGRVYVYFMDHMNQYGVFTESIFSSNLCQEIAIPTSPIKMTGEGLIAICILSCINVGRLNLDYTTDEKTDLITNGKSISPAECINPKEIIEVTDIIVRFLDGMIDYQTYVCPQIERCATEYRPLGIGMSDVFHLIAKKHFKYDSLECRQYIHELSEKFQYYLLKASCALAKERGVCKAYNKSKYSLGILPIDNYKRDAIDPLLSSVPYTCDWEGLRAEIKENGLRNTCLSAIPPTASSCAISNSTPGIDPPRSYVTAKLSKYGTFHQVIPDIETLKDYYVIQRDVRNEEYFKLIGVIQKFIDQGISTNSFYMYTREPAIGDVAREIMTAYKYGLKSLYYLNSYKGVDEDNTAAFSTSGIGCSGDACAI